MTKEECFGALKRLGHVMDDKGIKRVMEYADKDGNGRIDFEGIFTYLLIFYQRTLGSSWVFSWLNCMIYLYVQEKSHFLILLAQINQIAFHCFDEEFFLSTRNEKFRAILSLLPRFLDQWKCLITVNVPYEPNVIC